MAIPTIPTIPPRRPIPPRLLRAPRTAMRDLARLKVIWARG
jgi:hypothetical protein